MTSRTVVLYNPRAVFHTMPLALLAVGSALDRRKFRVRVIDGRLERDPAAAVLAAIDDTTVCLGVTVLTGAPIHDALRVSRAVAAARPGLPIVWGGWHPSLFPRECLAEPSIAAVVIGQGEATFAELVDRFAAGDPPDGCAGVVVRRSTGLAGAPRGSVQTRELVANPPRPLADVNGFPPHDYELVDVEPYFARKRRRQLDYVSSQGCRFRCTFCADPAVYGRGWVGLSPARVGSEIAAVARRHRIEEVAFQDETFFTSAKRVDAICEEFLRRGLSITWTATMRADQCTRLDDGLFGRAVGAGLRRVMIGVESGTQPMLDWMKKDMTLDHVYAAAERCARHGVGAIFNFIVGFPGEPEESMAATLALVKRLRAMHPAFETPIFYYRPYPGSEIAEHARASGYRFPGSLEEWADFDYVGTRGPWVTERQWRLVERFKFYVRHAWNPAPWRWPLRAVARWRCAHDRYGFPVEKNLVEWLRPPQPVS